MYLFSQLLYVSLCRLLGHISLYRDNFSVSLALSLLKVCRVRRGLGLVDDSGTSCPGQWAVAKMKALFRCQSDTKNILPKKNYWVSVPAFDCRTLSLSCYLIHRNNDALSSSASMPSIHSCLSWVPRAFFFFSCPTIWNGHACNDNCDQTWHVRTRADRRCPLFPLSVLALLLLWASCKGQGSLQKNKNPSGFPIRRTELLLVHSDGCFLRSCSDGYFDCLPWLTACSFLVVFHIVKGVKKQAGRATTHSSVSCLQSAPFTH